MGGKGSGRPGKPSSLRILHGDHLERLNNNEPRPGQGEVQPPYALEEGAQAVWDRLAPELIAKKVLTSWDVDAFAKYCEAVSKYQHFQEQLNEEGYVAKGSAGGVIKHPAWQMQRDCVDIIIRVGGRFGLNPSDRANLSIDNGKDDSGAGAERLLS